MSGRSSRRIRSTSSPVPIGTVDLVTMTVVVGQQRRKLAGRGVDERQVGMAVAAPRRRADRDEHRIGVAHGGKVGREGKPSLLPVGGDQIGEAGLVDRDVALIERRDLVGVAVDADDVVTEIRKAGPGHEPDITGTDHHHAHEKSVSPRWSRAAAGNEGSCELVKIGSALIG